jgi:mRNA interferase RelE/StbE
MYQLTILPKAFRELESLDKFAAKRILDRVSWLSENFDNITPLALKGAFSGTYKLRAGDWRVIYSFDTAKHVITVHLIGHRRDIYKLT